ncbi:unnamed protein product [Oppiella nova]|uniref:Ankyrin repeat domain-containing protein 16 n=1 Tax=Oppiella nova TaxID=334625 RepID=A0A7R9QW38_9ACAR|nr:unnamed protein product [Oppiella nova]CAG2177745.1 unnamed protein product [Oppiella nova]
MDQLDVNQTNREGKSALHMSAQNRHFLCAERLLRCPQIVVDPLNRSDWTPLMMALTKDNNMDVIRLLVDSGADLTLKNKDGWNGFHIAVRSGCLPQIQYLFARDSRVADTRSRTARTPLHTACLCSHHRVVDFLLDNCGYGCDERDSCGITPFMESLRNDCVDISRLLVRKHAIDARLADKLGRNGLHLSCETNAVDAIKYLVNDHKFDVNCVTSVGHLTPLHLAVKEGHIEAIRLLLEFGADTHLTDSKGRTPRDFAALLKRADCQQILTQSV